MLTLFFLPEEDSNLSRLPFPLSGLLALYTGTGPWCEKSKFEYGCEEWIEFAYEGQQERERECERDREPMLAV